MKKIYLSSTITFFLSLVYLLVGCKTTQLSTTKTNDQNDSYVVVLSMDGFRADYVTKTSTPNLDAMAKEGVSGALRPSYPSLTFPNHYAMATGLFPDHHGLVANEFWDTKAGHYRIGDRKAVENPVFYKGEPIWNTAKRQGIKSASYFWVGSETPVNGLQPEIWKKYDASVAYETRADSVIKWLSLPHNKRPHLIMWYIDEPDHTGHAKGPNSPITWAVARRCDSLVGYFRTQLAKLPIKEKVDFIVVSDHGMADYYKEKAVNITDYIPEEWIEHATQGPAVMVYIKKGYKEKAYQKLQDMPHCKVFKKENFPKRLHYGSSDRIGDIVIMADLGTYIYSKKGQTQNDGGAHGYDNALPEMYAVFRAVGPHFKKGQVIKDPIANVNIYPMICDLLNIKPSPNDGDPQLVKTIVTKN